MGSCQQTQHTEHQAAMFLGGSWALAVERNADEGGSQEDKQMNDAPSLALALSSLQTPAHGVSARQVT